MYTWVGYLSNSATNHGFKGKQYETLISFIMYGLPFYGPFEKDEKDVNNE